MLLYTQHLSMQRSKISMRGESRIISTKHTLFGPAYLKQNTGIWKCHSCRQLWNGPGNFILPGLQWALKLQNSLLRFLPYSTSTSGTISPFRSWTSLTLITEQIHFKDSHSSFPADGLWFPNLLAIRNQNFKLLLTGLTLNTIDMSAQKGREHVSETSTQYLLTVKQHTLWKGML